MPVHALGIVAIGVKVTDHQCRPRRRQVAAQWHTDIAQPLDSDSQPLQVAAAEAEWGCLSSWLDPVADDVNIRWTRELSEMVRPFTTGSDYVNQIGLETDEGSERIKAAFGVNYDRLVAVKNKFDPTNLFRHNQNIRPTT